MPWVAAAVVGASIIGGTIAGGKEADAIGEAAQAQAGAARDQLDFEKQVRSRALDMAAMTPQEIQLLSKQFQLQEQGTQQLMAGLQRQQELLDSVDPALKEAGRQAYALLRGENSAQVAPILAERARQRSRVEDNLRNELGSGYATSTAGIEALSRFDAQTDQLRTQTAQNLLNTSAAVRPDPINVVNQAFLGSQNLGNNFLSARTNLVNRQLSAISGTPVNFNNYIGTAGAPFVGDIARAQNISNMFGSIGRAAGAAGAAGAGGGSSGSAGSGGVASAG